MCVCMHVQVCVYVSVVQARDEWIVVPEARDEWIVASSVSLRFHLLRQSLVEPETHWFS